MRSLIATILLVLVTGTAPVSAAPYNTGWNYNRAFPDYRPHHNVQRRASVPRRAHGQRGKRVVKVRRGHRVAHVARKPITQRLSPAIARVPAAQVGKAITGAPAIVNAMASDLGKNLRRSYRGMAYCGLYLGDVVRRLGYSPPKGYALAQNWRRFGVAAPGPAPGVIAVIARGRVHGHVAVVKQVLPGGRVVLRGGNQGGGRVNDIVVSTRSVMAWRRPA